MQQPMTFTLKRNMGSELVQVLELELELELGNRQLVGSQLQVLELGNQVVAAERQLRTFGRSVLVCSP
tara:strand:+ start:81198 stop:81401 length:204 start_codon:yes stop_codon:yes gene_type:complete